MDILKHMGTYNVDDLLSDISGGHVTETNGWNMSTM